MGETASKLRSCKCQLYQYHFQPGARLCQWQKSDLDFKLGVSDTRRHPGKTHLHFCGKVVGITQRWPPTAVEGEGPWWGRGEIQCSVSARSALQVSTWSFEVVFLAKWSQISLCSLSRNSVNLVILPLLTFITTTSTPGCCLVAQSGPTLCDPMDYSLLGSSVHGISQARIREWVAMPFSRASSRPRDRTLVFCIGRRMLYHWTTREVHYYYYYYYYLQWILLFATKNPGGCTFFHPHYGECYL